MDIKEMLRALLRAGYTEEAIARGAKVHQSTISRILSGKIKRPGYIIVRNIMDTYNTQGCDSVLKRV